MSKKISQLPAAGALDGSELVEAVQAGINVQTTTQDIADLGGGGGTWGSITGTLSSQTDLYTYLRGTRTVTGAGASVQGDDNSLIIFNSATPFNFTLDQLTASSKISFVNIGAGDVTFVNGAGVTTSGDVILPGAVGTVYPTALVFYHTATTPRVINSTIEPDIIVVDTSGATITLDFAFKAQRVFVGNAAFATPKTIALANADNAVSFQFIPNMSNVAAVLTFPTEFTMQNSDDRWVDASHQFTAEVTGKHKFVSTYDGTDYTMEASNPYS